MALDPKDLESINRGRHYRNSRRAAEKHAELIELLGGECKKCGSEAELQVHHLDGRGWEPRETSSHARVNRYWREYLAGVRLGVLCKDCNGWDGHFKKKVKGKSGPTES